MLLCVSSRESSEVLSAATGEVQVVEGAPLQVRRYWRGGVLRAWAVAWILSPALVRRQRRPTPLRLRMPARRTRLRSAIQRLRAADAYEDACRAIY